MRNEPDLRSVDLIQRQAKDFRLKLFRSLRPMLASNYRCQASCECRPQRVRIGFAGSFRHSQPIVLFLLDSFEHLLSNELWHSSSVTFHARQAGDLIQLVSTG